MTKTTAEAASPPTPPETRTIRLGDLEHDPVAIDGREGRLTQLDDLLASIPAHGVLQSLRVRPWPAGVKRPTLGKRGRPKGSETPPTHGVIAGNRRLATLRRIRDEGGTILGVAVTDDWPVIAILGQENDTVAHEITTAENLQRLPESPVAEFRAFKRMVDEGKTVPEIAGAFGIPDKRVNQRLKLAALHADVLDALESGRITMEAAQAFTIEPDPKRQAAYLKKARGAWDLEPNRIKNAFTEQLIRGDSDRAKLVTKKAYVAAGGTILGDEFDEAASYWIDTEIVDRLVEERWAARKAKWIEDGWLFVESADEFGIDSYGYYRDSYGYVKTLDKARAPLSEKQQGAIAKLREEQAALVAKHPEADPDYEPPAGKEDEDDSPEVEAAVKEYYKLERQILDIESKVPRLWTDEQKAVSGVVYFATGSKEPLFGAVKRGTKLPKAAGAGGGAERPAASLDAPGDARVYELSKSLTEDLQRKVSGHAVLALQLVVAGLHAKAFGDYGVPVRLVGEVRPPAAIDESRPGKTFEAALLWAAAQDTATLLVYLAELVGPNVGVARQGGAFGPNERALIDLVDPPVSFDADGYFAGISKPLIALAWDEIRGELHRRRNQAALGGTELPDIPPFNPNGKKGDMAATAAKGARATGWLPPQLRTPSYDGPRGAAPAPVPETDSEDDDTPAIAAE